MKDVTGMTNPAPDRRRPKRSREQAGPDGPAPEELVMDLDMIAEEVIFGKNQARTYALRDVWYSSMKELVTDPTVPEDAKEEIMFLSLTNALLDMLMDVVPQEMALTFARNLDDYLAVTLVNKEYGVDLLKAFQEDFAEVMGGDFALEDKLMEAMESFEEEWWDTPREEIGGKSPNEAMDEMAERHEL